MSYIGKPRDTHIYTLTHIKTDKFRSIATDTETSYLDVTWSCSKLVPASPPGHKVVRMKGQADLSHALGGPLTVITLCTYSSCCIIYFV